MDLTQEEIEKILKTLPKTLKESLFSGDTAKAISRISERNNIDEDKTNSIANLVGEILVGLSDPSNLGKNLEEIVGPDKKRRVEQEIIRFILFPVRNELEKLYQDFKMTPRDIIPKKDVSLAKNDIAESTNGGEEEYTESNNDAQDIYREPIE